jgi:hypothetical protein
LLHRIKQGGRRLLAHIDQSPALKNNKQLRYEDKYKAWQDMKINTKHGKI